MSRPILIPNLNDLILRYQRGDSLLALSKETGVGRGPLYSALAKRGVELRGRSDAEVLKWTKIRKDRALVERQCGGAWAGRRGKTDPLERKIQRAKTMMSRLLRVGRYEREVAEALDAVQQLAVGRYNLDVALPVARVAVELVGASAQLRTAAHRERLEYLLDRGWFVLYVVWREYTESPRFRIATIRENAVALEELARRDEARRGGYRVIRGDGELLTRASLQLPNRPAV